MKLVNNARGQKPSVRSFGKMITLNSFIANAWKDFCACDVFLDDGKLTIVAGLDGEYTLSKEASHIVVCTYSIRDKMPRGALPCILKDNVLEIAI